MAQLVQQWGRALGGRHQTGRSPTWGGLDGDDHDDAGRSEEQLKQCWQAATGERRCSESWFRDVDVYAEEL